MITHTIVILDPKSKDDKVKVTNFKNSPKLHIFDFWNGHYTRHTFWSCLIRCVNMKWIRWVLLKIQSGHNSVHRRTDGQGDTSIPPYQLRWNGGIIRSRLKNKWLTVECWRVSLITSISKIGIFHEMEWTFSTELECPWLSFNTQSCAWIHGILSTILNVVILSTNVIQNHRWQ